MDRWNDRWDDQAIDDRLSNRFIDVSIDRTMDGWMDGQRLIDEWIGRLNARLMALGLLVLFRDGTENQHCITVQA